MQSRDQLLGAYARLIGLKRATPLIGSVPNEIVNDFNHIVFQIGEVLGEDIAKPFVIERGGVVKFQEQYNSFKPPIVLSKIEQLISYLEHMQHVNNKIVQIGSLYNSINDTELRSRCADLLSASDNFDRVINQATQVLEDRIRRKSKIEGQTGTALVGSALKSEPDKSAIKIAGSREEHEGIGHICRGLMLAFRNPTHHQIADTYSREDALKVCAFVDNLLSAIDAAAGPS